VAPETAGAFDHGAQALDASELSTLESVFERLFPAGGEEPGAVEIGAAAYLEGALEGAYRNHLPAYRTGLASLNAAAQADFGSRFANVSWEQQDSLMSRLERGTLQGQVDLSQQDFFALMRRHCLEGLFSDPIYGGNRDKSGWRVLGHPGVWLENSAEENLSAEAVTKGGVIQSLDDFEAFGKQGAGGESDPNVVQYDGSLHEPEIDADVVLVGVGGVGGMIAPVLCRAGLRVVGLESGPLWQRSDFVPDELGTAYYCRASMGEKFSQETPRWRPSPDVETTEATFSLGRMMNGVGGSVIHYGAWLRRFHLHHLRFRSHIVERWGEQAIPEGCSVADWPVSYDELEPHFTAVEHLVGVAGDESNPFVHRSKPLPMPPMRPFRMGEDFSRAACELGLHPHPAAVGQNTVPYNGFPETAYSAWNNGFGSWEGDKWHPGLTAVPEALATGNFLLRTHCRVTRVVTDSDGKTCGVEYVDRTGRSRKQLARTVILAAYTFENVRLMLLSGDGRHPEGIGNNSGQLGRHYMTKQFAHVDGYFPDRVFNRHTGPASQATVLDDFLAEDFDPVSEGGFVGGATLGAENQFLPLQIAFESLPDDVPGWRAAYREHLLRWQHLGVVRIQPDALPYAFHTIDLDPIHRDRSSLSMPVVRLTYDLMPNELKQAAFFEAKSAEILRAMGAVKTWAGPQFTGVCSSHDLGGCRMSDDPVTGVVDRELQVHDTPGLYVFSGAAFPTCPGINPTLTLWALCSYAAQRLVERLSA
jgi:gluconate 2-dehydrogenase alpha chain